MKQILAILIFTIGSFSFAQGQFTCDSVFVDSIRFQADPNDGLQLIAKNSNVDIISYPGFILFDGNGDTIAAEIVNYFGIGNWQTHLLEWINPIPLPFSGYLELHSGFYDSLRCTFMPINIADTTLGVEKSQAVNFNLYPNPNNQNFTISFKTGFSGEIEIINSLGQSVQKRKYVGIKKTSIYHELEPGFYFVRCKRANSNQAFTRKLIVRD